MCTVAPSSARPGPRLAEGLVTHIERQPVDVDLALSSGTAYVAALRRRGLGDRRGATAPTTARTRSSSRTRSSCTATSR